ncbi:D-erythronate dehydrogenase [Rhodovulum euryhalinum]|uniref:Nucleoside-diphosphate-sugar epimerase n=1 Tax=Rhodovulum euryhalinum TaxID=35805 RepID=A0A4R2K7J6_9RHOB|nr:D-erythronate dehydrogenase [Rhodovulum euryhalinum]TCO69321.1 nucleoside-diphosphate-sugar epimerase [Rhodovulum euryhalinum]
MRIAVTGAAGFIGRMVVRALAQRETITLDGAQRRIAAILATDIAAEPLAELAGLRRVHVLPGALSDPATLGRIAEDAPDLVIHLAAVVSGQAEAEFDLGMAVNLQGTIDLVNACRRMARAPVLVFSSSVAVFACAANDLISEDTLPAPQSSYGTQKLMGELLIRDATRKGFIRGRSLRFPTISVRPGAPNRAASSFASGIIRDPLAGLPATLPVGRDVRLHLASPARALDHILTAAALAQGTLRGETTITLPGISVGVGEMLDTLTCLAGPEVAARVRPVPEPGIEAMVASWPGGIDTPRARALGFVPNTDFADLVREHMDRMAMPAP